MIFDSLENELLVCVRSNCEGFKVGREYLFTKYGVIDSMEDVWLYYINGPYSTHLENMNKCYGFVEFENLRQ